MNFTNEQIQALDHGEAVPIVVEGRQYVVVSQVVYERVKRVIEYDDSALDPREAYPTVLKAWDSCGTPDDSTLYQDEYLKAAPSIP